MKFPVSIEFMIRPFAVLAMTLLASAAGQAQGASDEVRLRATVQAVVPLTDFSGTIVPVHFDPRFALTVRIESATPPVAGFEAGAVVTFAIHSPSLLFLGDATKGKTYDFVLHRKVEDGKVRFLFLELREVQAKSHR